MVKQILPIIKKRAGVKGWGTRQSGRANAVTRGEVDVKGRTFAGLTGPTPIAQKRTLPPSITPVPAGSVSPGAKPTLPVTKTTPILPVTKTKLTGRANAVTRGRGKKFGLLDKPVIPSGKKTRPKAPKA